MFVSRTFCTYMPPSALRRVGQHRSVTRGDEVL